MRQAKLVTFGKGGDVVYWSANEKTSGYGTPENQHAGSRLGPNESIPDGCPVIDKRGSIDAGPGIRLTIGGPMVNVDLADGEVDACPDLNGSIIAAAVISEPGNEFGTLARIHNASRARRALASAHNTSEHREAPGPLDFVSAAEYVRLWRNVGARIGAYQNGVIVWEDQAPTGYTASSPTADNQGHGTAPVSAPTPDPVPRPPATSVFLARDAEVPPEHEFELGD